MKVTKELYDRLLPGDLVLLKTPGQLIDSGWKSFGHHYSYWANNGRIVMITSDMSQLLGQMLFIEKIEDNELYFEGCDEGFTIEMFQELYPLMRGIY